MTAPFDRLTDVRIPSLFLPFSIVSAYLIQQLSLIGLDQLLPLPLILLFPTS